MKKSILIALALSCVSSIFAREKWTEEQANEWYKNVPFMAGCNFTPSDAINQIEMWSPETFNPDLIDKELGYAENLGFNVMRVFLHDLVWLNAHDEFYKNIDKYLEIADKHGIKTLFVFFDSCWSGKGKYGKQPEPKGSHNSGWVKSPNEKTLMDDKNLPMLEKYVRETVRRYASDKRVIGWDVFNEPGGSGVIFVDGKLSGKVPRFQKTVALLKNVFKWARAENPSQPLTSALFSFGKNPVGEYINPIQLAESDILSFHSYGKPDDLVNGPIKELKKYNRPIFCTEYIARHFGSVFDPCMTILKEHKIAAINWGLVAGKSETYLPWADYVKKKGKTDIWFHDVFHKDGTPYDAKEAEFIKKTMGKK